VSDVNLGLAFNLPPERAVEYFKAKGLRISSSALDMTAAAHASAFTVAGVMKGQALQDIRDAIDGAILDGSTFEQFVQRLKPKLQAQGWWGGKPHDPETGEIVSGRGMTPRRLKTVFQTNLQSAYMAGRYKAQLENADQRPYWQYVAILDNRTRPRHRALAGRIFRYDDPAWSVVYPPNGYNCRCRVKALSAAEFKAEGGALSSGDGRMESNVVDLGKRGKVPVTGYRDPGTGELFAPDPGFGHNPGQGAFGIDVELARKTQALKNREIRGQVWQALNNSPARLKSCLDWMEHTLATGRPGNTAQVLGFVDDQVAAFMRHQQPDVEPVRVVAINEKRLVHADSAKHQEGGIALTREQYQALPGTIATPDAVYFDTAHGNFVYTRDLADGGVIYAALDTAARVKGAGEIDVLVNAYRLAPGREGAGRLATKRYVRMEKEGSR
jgi:SPP1 gp7 family putative phage head morphogenesis protein